MFTFSLSELAALIVLVLSAERLYLYGEVVLQRRVKGYLDTYFNAGFRAAEEHYGLAISAVVPMPVALKAEGEAVADIHDNTTVVPMPFGLGVKPSAKGETDMIGSILYGLIEAEGKTTPEHKSH